MKIKKNMPNKSKSAKSKSAKSQFLLKFRTSILNFMLWINKGFKKTPPCKS